MSMSMSISMHPLGNRDALGPWVDRSHRWRPWIVFLSRSGCGTNAAAPPAYPLVDFPWNVAFVVLTPCYIFIAVVGVAVNLRGTSNACARINSLPVLLCCFLQRVEQVLRRRRHFRQARRRRSQRAHGEEEREGRKEQCSVLGTSIGVLISVG